MKRNILVALLGLGFVLMAAPGEVKASEGVADLRGSGTSGACFASSIYMDGVYKVMATCRDLKIALTPEKNKYVLWMEDETGKQRRLGEIVSGKLNSQIDQKFVKMFVTVERDGSTYKPSEDVLLTGTMREIDFGASVAPVIAIITPTPTPLKQEVVMQNTDVVAEQGSLGGTVASAFKIVLLGFGALLVIVGVTSFLSRRRSL